LIEDWGEHAQVWQPNPELRIASASFGIHKNTAWYHVPFPGDEGIYEPEWEEPPVIWDTLKELIKIVGDALEKKADATIDITELLRRTGRDLRVGSLSPRNAGIIAGHFKKNAT
jgi:hypothetical protein